MTRSILLSAPLAVLFAVEAAAAVTGIFFWRKVKNSHFKYFVIFLLYIFLSDFAGPIIDAFGVDNNGYYDFFVIPVEFLFYYWLFYKSFNGMAYKQLVWACSAAYIISVLVDILYFSKHNFFFYSFSYSIGNLLLLLLILLFFIQLTNSSGVLSYKRNMMFWICTGLLIYFLGSFPFYGLRNTFIAKYHHLHLVYSYVVFAFDYLMYLMFALSFIWGKPNLKSSSSSST